MKEVNCPTQVNSAASVNLRELNVSMDLAEVSFCELVMLISSPDGSSSSLFNHIAVGIIK